MKRRFFSIIVVFLLIMSCSFVFAISVPSYYNLEAKKDYATAQELPENITEYPVSVHSESLEMLNFVLPDRLRTDKSEEDLYYFIDDKGLECGFISSIDYMDNFDFPAQMPNHSSVTNDEYIEIPLGKCRLITLDADNGTAASGITGTHDVYYASVPIKGTAIYMLNFTMNDKKPETKIRFVEMLNKLSLKCLKHIPSKKRMNILKSTLQESKYVHKQSFFTTIGNIQLI